MLPLQERLHSMINEDPEFKPIRVLEIEISEPLPDIPRN